MYEHVNFYVFSISRFSAADVNAAAAIDIAVVRRRRMYLHRGTTVLALLHLSIEVRLHTLYSHVVLPLCTSYKRFDIPVSVRP